MRDYIGDHIRIDGRMIHYRLVTAFDYLEAKNEWSDEQIEEFIDKNGDAYDLITQIIALKQACFVMRRVNYSCQSLSDGLYELKRRLIHELEEKYNIVFDDEFVDNYGH